MEKKLKRVNERIDALMKKKKHNSKKGEKQWQ